MNIPIDYYRALIATTKEPYQINSDYDSSGDEIYSGVAPNRAMTSDPIWAIGKAVYTLTAVGGSSVQLLTHWSFLVGISWDNRSSEIFP